MPGSASHSQTSDRAKCRPVDTGCLTHANYEAAVLPRPISPGSFLLRWISELRQAGAMARVVSISTHLPTTIVAEKPSSQLTVADEIATEALRRARPIEN